VEHREDVTIARILPDVTGLDKYFDYYVPAHLEAGIQIGSLVKVTLHNRKINGFVLDLEKVSAPGSGETLKLSPVEKLLSLGPSKEVIDLCVFAAKLYCGRLRPFLVSAKPPRQISNYGPEELFSRAPRPKGLFLPESAQDEDLLEVLAKALAGRITFLQVPPLMLRSKVMLGLLHLWRENRAGASPGGKATIGSKSDGSDDLFFDQGKEITGESLLVLTALRKDARNLAAYLRKHDVKVAEFPEEWTVAASGQAEVVVGTRQAIFATVKNIGAIVVFDAYHETYQEERTPTWKATRLAAERSRRLGKACIFISPIPDTEILARADYLSLPLESEQGGWPYVQVIDRRNEDPRSGLYSPLLSALVDSRLREDRLHPVVFVYNRKGHSRLLACDNCGGLIYCEFCGGACEILTEPAGKDNRSGRKTQLPPAGTGRMTGEENLENGGEAISADAENQVTNQGSEIAGLDGDALLSCKLCRKTRPVVCIVCKSARMKTIKPGITKVARELGALLRREVVEVSADNLPETAGKEILLGTAAVLNYVRQASAVIFLDIDQDILRPKYKASEQTMSQIVSAARLLAPRSSLYKGKDLQRRLVIQTRMPEHPVIKAARDGNPSFFGENEKDLREKLGLPPYGALALISGKEAAGVAAEISSQNKEVALAPIEQGGFLVKAGDETSLSELLQNAGLPKRNVKIIVDPGDV